MTKNFRVAALSQGVNEFGLRGMVLVAADGEGWQVGANYLNVREEGTELIVPYLHTPNWHEFGFEIPERIPGTAPDDLMSEVWGPDVTPKKVVRSLFDR